MAYSEVLAERVRQVLADRKGMVERKMFGGIAFMIRGNMACGVRDEDLMLRLGAELATQAIEQPHTSYFAATGRPMRSMIVVAAEGHQTDSDLEAWVKQAADFAATLPPK